MSVCPLISLPVRPSVRPSFSMPANLSVRLRVTTWFSLKGFL